MAFPPEKQEKSCCEHADRSSLVRMFIKMRILSAFASIDLLLKYLKLVFLLANFPENPR